MTQRYDISDTLVLLPGERYVHVRPQGWYGGFYEVFYNRDGACDVIRAYPQRWQSRRDSILMAIEAEIAFEKRKPKRQRLRRA